ncbi:hypothetical protein EJB05_29646, partial [Eragrostis curvula]
MRRHRNLVVFIQGSVPSCIRAMAKESSYAEKLGLIEEMTTDVDAVQERVLAEILGRNGDSEYLAKKCGLAGATDRAAFREKVPMVSYEDLQPYIQRIADGDRSPILTGAAHPVSEFLTSSGTSGGERKLLPNVEDEMDRRQLLHGLATAVISQYIPGLDKGTALYFHFVKSETVTPGGLPARTALTSLYKSKHFKNSSGDTFSKCTSPLTSILCEDTFQSMYAQMLCRCFDVVCVGAVFASGLLRAIRFLQMNWEQLAADIEAGVLLNPRVTDHSFAPTAECSNKNDNWAGIVTLIWPNAKYLETIVTGAMAQYVPTLNYYSGGSLPVASMAYASSECSFGLNLHPLCDPSDVSCPWTSIYDAGDTSHADQLVGLAHVEAGREYELVVTTYAGLNRYRAGDVLRVTGFHNAAPQFRFVRRRNVLLSIEADKTNETELQRASSALLRPHGAAVLDYTSRACTDSIPGHYIIYWELLLHTNKIEEVKDDALERCCLEMEEALNAVYRQSRVADGSIGPLEIRVVRPGTFEALMDYAVSCGTSVGQYKVPRCVTLPPVIELLDSNVVSCHFSPTVPHWAP